MVTPLQAGQGEPIAVENAFIFFFPFVSSFFHLILVGFNRWFALCHDLDLHFDVGPTVYKTVISSSEADLEPKPRVSAANSEPTSSLEKSDCVVCVGQAPWPWPMSNTCLMKRMLEQL